MGPNTRKHMLLKYVCYGLLNSTEATVNSWAQTKINSAGKVVCGCRLRNSSKIHLNSCALSLDSAFSLNHPKRDFICEIICSAHAKSSRSDFVHDKQGKNPKLVNYQSKCYFSASCGK